MLSFEFILRSFFAQSRFDAACTFQTSLPEHCDLIPARGAQNMDPACAPRGVRNDYPREASARASESNQ